MHEDYPATVAIRRDLRSYGWLQPLRVFIDGRPVGSIFRNRTKEFLLPPGNHWIAVSLWSIGTFPVRITLQPGDWLELVCTSNNDVPLHPWHVHGFLILIAFSVLCGVFACFFPQALNAFLNAAFGELILASVLAWIGMILFFIRSFRKGGWRGPPVLYLTRAPASEEQSV